MDTQITPTETPTPVGGGGTTTGTPESDADVRWATYGWGDNYLVDADGNALYFFANDIAGSESSACNGGCVDNWPVFDVKELTVGDNLEADSFSRFQREDGSWQTTYLGRPLYTFVNDSDGEPLAGDTVGGRWYAARDYFLFYAADSETAPRGSDENGTPYLTNRAGRAIYIFENDTPGDAAADPWSACEGMCLEAWPAWNAPASMEGLILPSDLDPDSLDWFEREDGESQLTYSGWPLYYFAADDQPGEVDGATRDNWSAIRGDSFGGAPAAGSGY